MEHRHLIPSISARPSLAAIQDIMERGDMEDWIALARLVQEDPGFRAKVSEYAKIVVGISEQPERPAFWHGFCQSLYLNTDQHPGIHPQVILPRIAAAS